MNDILLIDNRARTSVRPEVFFKREDLKESGAPRL